MNLPRGVTGFHEKGASPLSINDLKLFRSVCHSASRRLGGKVIVSEDAYSRQTNNFAILTIAMREKTLAVLLHAYFPIVGLAEPLPPCQQTIHFVDALELAEAVNAAGRFEV